jgi:hypothetical protein
MATRMRDVPAHSVLPNRCFGVFSQLLKANVGNTLAYNGPRKLTVTSVPINRS